MEYQVLIETVEETKQISSGVTKENVINILEEIINTKINEGYFLFLDLLNRCKKKVDKQKLRNFLLKNNFELTHSNAICFEKEYVNNSLIKILLFPQN